MPFNRRCTQIKTGRPKRIAETILLLLACRAVAPAKAEEKAGMRADFPRFRSCRANSSGKALATAEAQRRRIPAFRFVFPRPAPQNTAAGKDDDDDEMNRHKI